MERERVLEKLLIDLREMSESGRIEKELVDESLRLIIKNNLLQIHEWK